MKLSLNRIITICSLCLLPGTASAADISVGSETIIRFEQLEPSGAPKQDFRPLTQYLGLDATKLADGNLSVHLYGWGRADLAETSYSTSRGAGDLAYGFLRYRIDKADADLRAGRIFVRDGSINEQVDGAAVRTALPFGFGLSAFGGATVHTKKLIGENSDGKGDYITGGRLSFRQDGLLELGFSGVYEEEAPVLVSHVTGSNRKVGADIRLTPHRSFELVGHSTYNTETNKFAEHRYLLSIKPAAGFVLSGDFTDFRDQSLFFTWAMRSGAAIQPGDKSQSFGGSAAYSFGGKGEVSLGYKHYKREIGRADRYGGDLKLAFLDGMLRSGLGYYYLQAGGDFAISGTESASYHNLRAYLLHDNRIIFFSVEALGQYYRKKINDENSAFEALASLGYHITPALALSGDISYGTNPDYQKEIRGLVRLTYDMTYGTEGGKK